MKVGDKRSYENMTYVCHLCHESFASKIDLYKDYLKHIAFFKCEICKSDKTQFGTMFGYFMITYLVCTILRYDDIGDVIIT